MNDTERLGRLAGDLLGDHQRGTPRGADAVNQFSQPRRHLPAVLADPVGDRPSGTLADDASWPTVDSGQIHPAHPGLGAECHEGGMAQLAGPAFAQAVLGLGQDDYRAALRGLVGERG